MSINTTLKIFPKTFRLWNKKLFLYDTTVVFFIFLLFGIFRPDYVLFGTYLFIIFYLIKTKRKILFYHLALSSVMAIVWVSFMQNYYIYNYKFITLFNMSSFPLLSWAIGLLGVYIIYRQHRYFPEKWGFVRHLILFTVFYWILLVVAETIGYNYADVQMISGQYASLPICECMHMPNWIRAVYFFIGPLFFTIAYLLGLERLHIRNIT